MSDTVIGELTAHRVVGDDFWSIATIRTKDAGEVAAVGKLLGAEIGDTIECEGMWSKHKVFGLQFKVRSCEVLLPRSDNGVIAWMAGRLPHVGKARAQALLSHFGGADQLWQVIENEPARLAEAKGITAARASDIVEAYAHFRADRDRMIRFKRWGLTDFQISKILGKWGDESEQHLRANPYDLCNIESFGFLKADAVAQRMGVPRDAVPRIRCGLLHTMRQASMSGHCYVATGKLVHIAAGSVLRLDGALVAKELAVMRKSGELVMRHRPASVAGKGDGKGARTFLRALDQWERVCADRIKALLSQRKG